MTDSRMNRDLLFGGDAVSLFYVFAADLTSRNTRFAVCSREPADQVALHLKARAHPRTQVSSNDQAATGLALLMRARRFGVFNAFQMSLRCWRFNQNSAVFPNAVASINAVSAVIARRFVHNSFTVFRLTPIDSASRPCVNSRGSRNSSVIISPTLTGCFLVMFISYLRSIMALFITCLLRSRSAIQAAVCAALPWAEVPACSDWRIYVRCPCRARIRRRHRSCRCRGSSRS